MLLGNREELQSFLGFANYYREFVPFFAQKAEPLNAMLRKNSPFAWSQVAHDSFEQVKQGLIDATGLAAPNESGRFVLDTDASAVAIAGILHQEQEFEGRTDPPSHSLRKQNSVTNANELWGTEARNVCCVLLH